ncbi:hypothetical protein ACI8B_160025 [Acinetobacter proteolyticus]|uniref:Uncharacterized protein n=1 Tax=Acinetobacter proteolyticus TaxID=1776741 RepID=A0A653K3K5_9GAMM|nr:hypothetical protein ACI8B_160025 [Acinetobacter proteolyticus]
MLYVHSEFSFVGISHAFLYGSVISILQIEKLKDSLDA